jgi:tRNA-splicing ligase RtcB
MGLKRIDKYKWLIPKSDPMRVEGLIYADEKMIPHIKKDNTPLQVRNVACLPGILGHSLAMPDIHWGYGFPIGGVAAFDCEKGIISPGGIGYDINCGVRLLRTNLTKRDLGDKLSTLVSGLFANIPSGVGSRGKIFLSPSEIKEVLAQGARWAVKKGYGRKEDLQFTEENGCLSSANPEKVSKRAIERGQDQLGTLGAGNHFLEIQEVDQIYDQAGAEKFGLFLGQIMIMIHTGSRGLGYQICDDYLKILTQAARKYGIVLPDRQLACAPFSSPEGENYFQAMCGAANYAWANRQCITHWVRETFQNILGGKQELVLIYDVAHNIGKVEEYEIEGKKKKVIIHRKGATRSFPPGHRALPENYQAVGQPVLIPGTMGSHSYLLLGTEKAMEETWGSTCHGAGRVMSRSAAVRSWRGEEIVKRLTEQWIIVRMHKISLVAEEAPQAYKDVDLVVEVCHQAGISKKVARFRPLSVIKG